MVGIYRVEVLDMDVSNSGQWDWVLDAICQFGGGGCRSTLLINHQF
jgi:hypothetical protein